jgi:fibronectin-binding autotransporter adhesin
MAFSHFGIKSGVLDIGSVKLADNGGTRNTILTASAQNSAKVDLQNIQNLTASYAKIDTLDVETINSITTTEQTLEVSDAKIIAGLSASSGVNGLQIGGSTTDTELASVLYDGNNLDLNLAGTTYAALSTSKFEVQGVVSGSGALQGASVAVDGAVTGAAGTFNALAGTSLALQSGGITAAGSIAGATSVDGSGDLTMGTITMTGFSVDADGDTALKSLAVDDSSTIGCDSDTDLLTFAAQSVTMASDSALTYKGTAVTSTGAELNLVDGSGAGNVVNSKAVIYSAAGQVAATTVSASSGYKVAHYDGNTPVSILEQSMGENGMSDVLGITENAEILIGGYGGFYGAVSSSQGFKVYNTGHGVEVFLSSAGLENATDILGHGSADLSLSQQNGGRYINIKTGGAEVEGTSNEGHVRFYDGESNEYGQIQSGSYNGAISGQLVFGSGSFAHGMNAGTVTISAAGALAGATSIDGSGDLTMGSITMAEFTVDSSGNTDVDGTLNVEGAATLQSTLSAQSASFSTVYGSGAAQLASTLTVEGAASMSSTLTVESTVSGAAGTFDALAGTSLALQSGGITAAGAIAGATSIDGSGDLTMGSITMSSFSVDDSGNTDAASLDVGGGYGSTGVTISSMGAITADSSITTDTQVNAASAAIGGGYGSTGATVSSAGVLSIDGQFNHAANIIPAANGSLNIGSTSYRYNAVYANNMYTGDFHMKNERGDWTLFEESDHIRIRNNKTGQTFKLGMSLIEE